MSWEEIVLPIHLVAAVLSAGIFLTALIASLLLLWKERWLKLKTTTTPPLRLPPLETLERFSARLVGLGILPLAITLMTGMALGSSLWPPHLRGHSMWAVVASILYIVVLKWRWRERWQSRKGILLSLLGFISLMLALLGVEPL